MRADLYLDTLDLADSGRLVTGLDLVAQRIRLRLALHQGDVLRDTSIGFPWADWLSTKPVPVAQVRARVRSQLALVTGVASVTSVQASVSGGILSVSADVTTDEGSVSILAAISDEGTRNMSFTANFWGRAGSVLA